jgi:hypothetical protein
MFVQQTTTTKKKSCTAAAQQASMMRQQGITGTHPRKQFHKDLLNFLQACKAQREELLLAGNFNEALGTNISGMTKICLNLGLVDILQNHHDTEDTPTYVRGTTRIGYALATLHVTAACTSCGYEPFEYRFTGDHRVMFLDFITNALFVAATVDLSTPAEREFNSGDKASNCQYIDAKFNYLAAHHWLERLSAQQADPTHNHALAESLDCNWVRASKHATNQVKKKPRCPFSHQLVQHERRRTSFNALCAKQPCPLTIAPASLSSPVTGMTFSSQPDKNSAKTKRKFEKLRKQPRIIVEMNNNAV